MEQFLNVFGSIGKDGKMVLLINDKTFKLDEDGGCRIDLNDLVIGGDKNVFEFDRMLDTHIGNVQKVEFYEMILDNSSQFGRSDVCDYIGVDKDVARLILIAGGRNRVLNKYHTQYKLNPHKRDQIHQILQMHKRELGQEDVPEPFKVNAAIEEMAVTMGAMGIGSAIKRKKTK